MNKTINAFLDYCFNNHVSHVYIDFWGTILERKCNDFEIKRKWAKELSIWLKFEIDHTFLLDARIQIESFLSRKQREVDFYTVAEILYDRLSVDNKCLLSIDRSIFISKCISIEITDEIKSSYVIKETVESIYKIKRNGCKIIILSDYYLHKTDLISVLKAFNIDDLPDEILVSCEVQFKKADKSLYTYANQCFGIVDKKAIMIGDNYISDYKNPREMGIDSFCIKSKHHSEKATFDTIVSDVLSVNKKELGYTNYVFLLYLFIERLYKYIIINDISDVYFLSREGMFLKSLFDSYVHNRNLKINVSYLYVSRKAVYPASLDILENESFDVLKKEPDLNFTSFLESISFPIDKIESFKHKYSAYNISYNSDLWGSDLFKELMKDTEFKSVYAEVIDKQRKTLCSYLEQEHFFSSGKKVIVDVGWNGTMQDCLYKSTNNRIEGVYIGLLNSSINRIECPKHGLIFSENPTNSDDIDIWKYDYTFLERLLTAPHGGTVGYNKMNGIVTPILQEYDGDSKNYQIIKETQKRISDEFLVIDNFLKDSAYCAEDFYYRFLSLHKRNLFCVSLAQLKLQHNMLENQTQNFGSVVANGERMNTLFSKKKILKKSLRVFNYIRNVDFISKILIHKKAFVIVKLLYFFKYIFVM